MKKRKITVKKLNVKECLIRAFRDWDNFLNKLPTVIKTMSFMLHHGESFAYYNPSAYCSKKCCVDHILEGDNDILFEVSPDKSLEEYDREFVRYYIKE